MEKCRGEKRRGEERLTVVRALHTHEVCSVSELQGIV